MIWLVDTNEAYNSSWWREKILERRRGGWSMESRCGVNTSMRCWNIHKLYLHRKWGKIKKDVYAYHAEREEKVDGCDRCRDTALYITSYCFRSDSLKNGLKLLSILRQSVQCTDISPTYFCSLEMTRRSRLIQGVWPQRIRIWSCERGTYDEISALGYSSSLKVSMIYKICFNAFDRKTQSARLQTHTHKAEIISFILPQICDNVADWDLHK